MPHQPPFPAQYPPQLNQNKNVSPRESLLEEIKAYLAAGIVDIELDDVHFSFAMTAAFARYRQRSGNALEESFLFMDIQPEVSTYTLPAEVQEVRVIYRRTLGGTNGSGSSIDPFSLAFSNNIYLLSNPGGLGGGGSGMLATYDFAVQYQNLIGRMFGRDIMYTYDTATKRLTLHRRITGVEQICLHIDNARPESVLLQDVYARPWLRDWSIAVCKQIMGEARSKFGNIAGPQGGITMNGSELKAESKAEFERLDNELAQFVDQHSGYPFLVG